MPKVRVYELAKELGVESKTVLTMLKDMGEFVRSASSTVEAPVERRLKEKLATRRRRRPRDPVARTGARHPSPPTTGRRAAAPVRPARPSRLHGSPRRCPAPGSRPATPVRRRTATPPPRSRRLRPLRRAGSSHRPPHPAAGPSGADRRRGTRRRLAPPAPQRARAPTRCPACPGQTSASTRPDPRRGEQAARADQQRCTERSVASRDARLDPPPREPGQTPGPRPRPGAPAACLAVARRETAVPVAHAPATTPSPRRRAWVRPVRPRPRTTRPAPAPRVRRPVVRVVPAHPPDSPAAVRAFRACPVPTRR